MCNKPFCHNKSSHPTIRATPIFHALVTADDRFRSLFPVLRLHASRRKPHLQNRMKLMVWRTQEYMISELDHFTIILRFYAIRKCMKMMGCDLFVLGLAMVFHDCHGRFHMLHLVSPYISTHPPGRTGPDRQLVGFM